MAEGPREPSDGDLRGLLEQPSRVAVIGMKERGPAHSVPGYLARHGFEVIPVNPKYDEVDGRKAFDTVDEIEEPVRIVEVFRRSEAVPEHVDEILSMEPLPEAVWLQRGIRNDSAAGRLAEAGIEVVQDRCMKVEHARLVEN